MKRSICALCSLLLFFGARSQQPNSASFLNDVLQLTVQDFEKKNVYVAHSETGTMTISGNSFSDYTTRQLRAGNRYTILAFTDPRIGDFKLMVWKINAAGQYEKFDSADDDNHAKLAVSTLGDREVLKITPEEDGVYAFQLISTSYLNKTGRYGVIILAETVRTRQTKQQSNSTTTTTKLKTYLSVDYYSIAYLKKDENDKWVVDGNWSRTVESSMFVLNPEESVFEHTTPQMNSSYYVQSKSNNGDIPRYEVKSDVGNTYTFDINTKADNLDIYGKTESGQWYVKRHHLKKVWTE